MATIFSPLFHPASGASGNVCYRVFCPVSGGNLGQLRVTFLFAGGASACVCNHASIGIAATAPATTNITELLFSGTFGGSSGGGTAASGFNLPSGGNSITSDWLTFSGGSGATSFAVHMDFPNNTTLYSYNVAEAAGNDSWGVNAAFVDYLSNATSGGYTQQTQLDVLVDLIETQAAAAAVTLMGAMCQ